MIARNMIARISKWILKIFGWKIEVELDEFPPKYVIIVVPHTSNWDFPKGLLLRKAYNQDIKFAAKDALFKWPLGPIMKALGGYPVNRQANTNMTQAIIDIFNSKETFKLNIAPEGTRSKVDKLKTGFYYIAKGANVPIIMCKFDYGNKILSFSKPFYTSDDMEADFKKIDDYFKGVVGKYPEKSYRYGE